MFFFFFRGSSNTLLIVTIFVVSDCLISCMIWREWWGFTIVARKFKNSPEGSLFAFGMVTCQLSVSAQHLPHHLHILISTGLYIVMKLQKSSTIFASFNASRDSEPDAADREDHLVPKIHQPFFDNFHLLSAFDFFLVIPPTSTTHSNRYAPLPCQTCTLLSFTHTLWWSLSLSHLLHIPT